MTTVNGSKFLFEWTIQRDTFTIRDTNLIQTDDLLLHKEQKIIHYLEFLLQSFCLIYRCNLLHNQLKEHISFILITFFSVFFYTSTIYTVNNNLSSPQPYFQLYFTYGKNYSITFVTLCCYLLVVFVLLTPNKAVFFFMINKIFVCSYFILIS